MKVEEDEEKPFETQSTRENLKDKPKASLKDLYKYATKYDYFLIFVGVCASMGMGALQPLFFYFMGDFFGSMGPGTTANEFYDKAKVVAYELTASGFVFMCCGYLAVSSFVNVGARQSYQYRIHYFKAIMGCDPGWFDLRQVAELPQSVTTETLSIERATGDKVVVLIFTISMIFAAFIIGLVRGCQIQLFCLCFGPAIVSGFFLSNSGLEQSAKQADSSYKIAGGIAEEALQEIKTVSSLNGQKHEAKKYFDAVADSQKSMFLSGLKIGGGTALGMCSYMLMNGCNYMLGAYMIHSNQTSWIEGEIYDVGMVLTVIMVSLMAFNNISLCIPSIKLINQGRIAALSIKNVLENKSKLQQGTLKQEIVGAISFTDVHFAYPSAPNSEILKGLSFELESGQRLGVVGSTGSGKSTIVQLLLRYYEPTSGTITIDGNNIMDYPTDFLRANIGLVSQEPLLFNTSIYENIRYGKQNATKEEIEFAAQEAGAHSFIDALPNKYQTTTGSKGSQLSGGQKQRIAIARAFIRNPKILLLDEATSALDRQTEHQVVEAIDKAMPNSTRITIAQNLLTIKDSTFIIMIDQGNVFEFGNHRQLMKQKGKYYHLIKMQKIQQQSMDDEQVKAKITDMDETKTKEAEQVQKEDAKNVRKKMMMITKKERVWLLFGVIGSCLVGSSYPLVGFFAGNEIFVLSDEGDDMVSESARYAGWLFFLAFWVCVGLILESVCYPKMSANITATMRKESFRAILSYEAAFFDLPENNCSALSARLCNDCEKVNGLGGNMFGIIVGVLSGLAVAHGVSAGYSWRMSLVFLSIVPCIVFAIGSTFMAQSVGVVKFNYESCTALAADAIMNYRTAKAFNLETVMLERYLEPITMEFKNIQKKAQASGITYGLGHGLFFGVYALIFWFGSKLVVDGYNDFKEMVIAIIICMYGSGSIFMAGIFAPDVKNGIEAGKRLFKILDYVPSIQVNTKEGEKKEIEGKIELKDVVFCYPNRNYMALKSVNFTVEPGKRFAIIGRTGSGKSTVIQLVMRLYDPLSGSVLIDDINLKSYNLKHLRKQIGLVGQEPVLFTGTIAENISYGIKASLEEIEEAARKAQAIEFIMDPKYADGFERQVGIKGSMLSGGQKQRIAIARALIRNPKILIFDEATSALDSKTEQLLLSAIKDVMAGRTTIMIAHRLKTISEADSVMVLESGKILEIGTREELMNQGGYFYNMISNL
ncbi:unnamed protein product [Blepharisma stoltei]|uniref:Uncharacterized protein n=1 Tax=Blepharisma stoltei TaxID=1481888 RepID=A0AAU9JZG3_9CILI|nr:unnamed protein product [Blepharisma stoltei]